MPSADQEYPEAEAARRRDEVIRRMANTPPQPRVSHLPKKKTSTGEDRAKVPKNRPSDKS